MRYSPYCLHIIFLLSLSFALNGCSTKQIDKELSQQSDKIITLQTTATQQSYQIKAIHEQLTTLSDRIEILQSQITPKRIAAASHPIAPKKAPVPTQQATKKTAPPTIDHQTVLPNALLKIRSGIHSDKTRIAIDFTAETDIHYEAQAKTDDEMTITLANIKHPAGILPHLPKNAFIRDLQLNQVGDDTVLTVKTKGQKTQVNIFKIAPTPTNNNKRLILDFTK